MADRPSALPIFMGLILMMSGASRSFSFPSPLFFHYLASSSCSSVIVTHTIDAIQDFLIKHFFTKSCHRQTYFLFSKNVLSFVGSVHNIGRSDDDMI